MYIAWLKPRMCACALSLSKGRRRVAKRGHFDKLASTSAFRQAQRKQHRQ